MSSSLTHSPADIIRQLLIDGGMGSDINNGTLLPLGNWPVYVAAEPNEPDDCTTVYDTTGRDDARLLLGGELQQHWGLQIRVRSTDHQVGWAKIIAIRTFLSESVKTNEVAVDNSHYLVWAVTKISTPLTLGYDNSNSKRRLFTLNCTAAIDQRS